MITGKIEGRQSVRRKKLAEIIMAVYNIRNWIELNSEEVIRMLKIRKSTNVVVRLHYIRTRHIKQKM